MSIRLALTLALLFPLGLTHCYEKERPLDDDSLVRPNESGFRLEFGLSGLGLITGARYQVDVFSKDGGKEEKVFSRGLSSHDFGNENGGLLVELPCLETQGESFVEVSLIGLEISHQWQEEGAWLDPGLFRQDFSCGKGERDLVRFDMAPAVRGCGAKIFDGVGVPTPKNSKTPDPSGSKPIQGHHFCTEVNFSEVFCAASFNCQDAYIDDAGHLDISGLLGFACSASAVTQAKRAIGGTGLNNNNATAKVELYMSDLVLICDGEAQMINPAIEGRRQLNESLASAAATYTGEMLTFETQSCFWNQAMALNIDSNGSLANPKNCRLRARGTAASARPFTAGVSPPGVRYPYIEWDIPLTNASGDFLCTEDYELWGENSPVTVKYTSDEGAFFRRPYFCGGAPRQACGGYTRLGDDGVSGANLEIKPSGALPNGQQELELSIPNLSATKTLVLPEGVYLDEEAGCCLDNCCQVGPPGGIFTPIPVQD